jgi:hypothetical protein
MNRPQAFLVAMVLPWMLSACKKDEMTSETGRKLESTPAALRGTWQSDCVPTTTLNMVSSQREYVFNSIGDFDRLERYYSDPQCRTLTATYKVVGTVEIKGPYPEKTELDMINFTVNEAYLTVTSEAVLQQLNAMRFCGRSDWRLNEDVHVTNAECEGSKVQKGGVQFDSFDIRDGKLYLGQKLMFLGKDDASERPTELDLRAPYAKK